MREPFDADDLTWALEKNAAAKAAFEAMDLPAREKFRRRAAAARTPEELTDAVNSLVGFQIGHPPYQL